MAAIFFKVKLFFVSVLLIQAWHITLVTCCPSVSVARGFTTKDMTLEVGSPLRIQCSLFSTKIQFKNTIYNASSENLLFKFKTTSIKNLTIVDELTAEYFVENATVNDTGIYSCYVRHPDINGSMPYICNTNVVVGYKPLSVENFTCISLEFFNLTCTWKLPFNPVKTDYSIYELMLRANRKRRCAEKLENGCSWTTATNPIYMRSTEKLNFLIVGNNSLGTSEYLFSVDHFKIVKPGAPQRAEFTNITPTSMMLHCTFPKNMMYGEFKPGLLFSIQYRPKDYPAPYKEIRVYFQSQGSLEITDLIPYTEYEFKIRCRSNVSDSDLMWSPLLTASMGTHPDVPYWAPETASSGFDIQVILGNRTISLYWKAIPFNYENGPNLEYMVQYHIHHVPSRIIRESAVFGIGKNTTYSFESMDVNSAYMFNIFARNEIGTSVNTSQIIVDKADKLLDGPRDITVIYNKGNYNISWKAPNNQIKYYTLFWCEGPERGEGAIDWVHVQQTEYQLNLSDKSTWYQFAVAANTDIQTSGMFWASCIVVGGERFEIKSVELTPKHSTSLKIQWSLDCEAQKRIVEHYNIHYCETGRVCSAEANCTNHEKVEVIKNRHLNEYYLVSLKPYTCYKAFMRVLTSNGWSADSNIASESTLSSAPSDSPGDVKILRIDGTKIRISFVPPQIPNGIVTRYVVTYNKTSDGTSHHVQVRVQETKMDHGAYIVDLQKSLFYYSNYSIEVEACVEKACSPPSKPVYALTGISRPGIMKSPSVEILKSSMNISWDPPFLPNGPLDLYQVVKESTNSSIKEEYNITGRNFLILSLACSDEEKEEKIVYSFKVRAVNFRGDMALYGDFSRQTETILCVSSTSFGLIIGSTAGAVIGFVLFVLLMYCVISW